MPLDNNQGQENNLQNFNNSKSPEYIPVLCKNSCGFFGSSQSYGFCSMCFKQFKESQMTAAPSGDDTNDKSEAVTATNDEKFQIFDKTENSMGSNEAAASNADYANVHDAPVPANLEINNNKGASVDMSPSSDSVTDKKLKKENDDTPESDAPLEDKAPELVQEDTSKCFTCKRKLNHLTIQCKCKLYFCRLHRASTKHNCQYDFKEQHRKYIREKLPHFKSNSNIKDL